MRENFHELVKQKTDTELEAVSTNGRLYTAMERLVALNELQFRNKLPEELLMTKKHLEGSITPAVKAGKNIYNSNRIWVASMLGGPLVAGYLIAENFKAFHEREKAKKAWFFYIIGTIVLFIVLISVPESIFEHTPPNFIATICTAVAYLLIKRYQEKDIAAFVALGGKLFSWWRTIGIGLLGGIIFLVMWVAFLLFLNIIGLITL